ncbi:histidine kinase [Parabacteroides sp. PF5-6]|uniref:sensor histidine kinase n=1 Tax=Parabacteroides sp. PF5-6 TaxID=1742403 RepID=UPI002405E22C|nr:histidine kinase [Parabacteroides sp. PF5-6]MDF9829429.1 hypothetical protein [Parabacteroides sp. PF5-6]
MQLSGKRYVFIGFILSVLLSLFVNFSLLMRIYDRLRGNMRFPEELLPSVDYYLYFSLGWFFLLAFILFAGLMFMFRLGDRIFRRKEYKVFLFAIGVNVVVALGMVLLYPVASYLFMSQFVPGERPAPWQRKAPLIEEDFMPGAAGSPFFDRYISPPRFYPRPLITEHLFILVTAIFITVLLRMLNSRQQIALEYEKLKTESIQSSYNALMGQVNPHFFFNSLNGLSSLIRNDEKEKTLIYIDKLSGVFRYILQSNRKELVELNEELEFVRAYLYLLEVRYEGKLFFSLQVDTDYLLMFLPILSILPLVENAVKHNVISKQYPLQVDIYTTAEKELVVSNNIQPRVDEINSNGVGLKNLWGRYQLLTGKDIRITNTKGYFKVFLPLQKNQMKS